MSEIIQRKKFSSDKYFPLSDNPTANTLEEKHFFDFFSADEKPRNKDSSDSLPLQPDRKTLSVDPVQSTIETVTEEKPHFNVDNVESQQKADSTPDPLEDPVCDERDPGGDRSPDPEPDPYTGPMDGYQHLLTAFYPVIFRVVGNKLQTDMTLSSEETTELVDCTTPLMRKYATRDFKYGEELRCALGITNVFMKKMNQLPVESEEKTVDESSQDPKNMQDMTEDLKKKLEEKGIDYNNLEPFPLDELQLQKIRNFYKRVGIEGEISEEKAEKIAAGFKAMGFNPDQFLGYLDQLPDELLKNMLKNVAF